MKKFPFVKMVASGNDFVIAERVRLSRATHLSPLAREVCDRKYGIGADGLLVLDESKTADVKMRVFNADGSEAEMCGNGARCVASYLSAKRKAKSVTFSLETKAGLIQTRVRAHKVSVGLTEPKGLRVNIPLRFNGRNVNVHFIDTGVPHAVIFVEGIKSIELGTLGPFVRFHKRFSPAGANVNLVEVLEKAFISVRTYERGVEDETLACGTGAVASALITNYALRITDYGMMKVKTKGGEILNVYFKRTENGFTDVSLEGAAEKVFSGDYILRGRQRRR